MATMSSTNAFKVWTVDGRKRVVVAETFSALLQKARDKFSLPESELFLEDGTQVDEDAMVLMKGGDVVYLREHSAIVSASCFENLPALLVPPPSAAESLTSDLDSSFDIDENSTSTTSDDESMDTASPSYWMNQFKLPLQKFPPKLISSCMQKKRPNPQDRREMIRILAAEVHNKNARPGRKNLEIVCQKLINKYPKSFQDQWGNVSVGSGYRSILNQLENKINDFNRKKKVSSSSDDVGDGLSSKEMKDIQKKMQENPPRGISEKSKMLENTFPLQQTFFEEIKPISDVKKEWPLLCELGGVLIHFDSLMKIDSKKKYLEEVERKGFELLDYFLQCKKRDVIANVMNEIDAEVRCNKTLLGRIAWIRLLPAYFEEDFNLFIGYVGSLQEVGANEDLPNSPFLATQEDEALFKQGAKYHVIVEKTVLNQEPVEDVLLAVLMLMGVYYMFNMAYPSGLATTLTFIQKCLVGVSPQNKKRRKYSEKPKLLSLLNDLASFKWKDL